MLVYYEPVTFLLTSDEYPKLLQNMLIEGLPEKLPNRQEGAGRDRKPDCDPGRTPRHHLAGRSELCRHCRRDPGRRLLRTGLIGTYDLPKAEREKRRQAARREVERIAVIMENEPVGIQIGIVDDTLPNQTFEICRSRDGTVLVAVSPFRLGELPNVRLGVATVTAARRGRESLPAAGRSRCGTGRPRARAARRCCASA